MPKVSVIGRVAAIAAVLVAAVAVAVVLLTSAGGNYTVKARFQNASQIVKGNLVQVSGKPVGKVKEITLTPDGQAELTLAINDDYKPLREGTEAVVRASSLSGIANRYIDLRLGPANGREVKLLDQTRTTTAVDLDTIFNIFGPKEREALKGVIRGSAQQYSGRGAQGNRGLAYLNPNFASLSALFKEVNRDPQDLRRLLGSGSRLMADIAERQDDLAGLIDHLATTTGAIARQSDALQDAIQQLPGFMRRANTTFVNLRATLDDLDPLVDESKPVAKKLRKFLPQLRQFARDARPTISDLSRIVRLGGANNDLIELTRSNIPVRDIALGPVQANGQSREGAFPASERALRESTPELASARPYAPELLGWFDDFSHSGQYDALGGVSRAALHVNLVSTVNGALPISFSQVTTAIDTLATACQPPAPPAACTAAQGVFNALPGLVPEAARGDLSAAGAKLYQTNRCPGAVERNVDGSNPFIPAGVNCDPNQVPQGP